MELITKQLAAFPHKLLAHWLKTNDTCHSDFFQTLERMLAKMGFKLTTPGKTACVTNILQKYRTEHREYASYNEVSSQMVAWIQRSCLKTNVH